MPAAVDGSGFFAGRLSRMREKPSPLTETPVGTYLESHHMHAEGGDLGRTLRGRHPGTYLLHSEVITAMPPAIWIAPARSSTPSTMCPRVVT